MSREQLHNTLLRYSNPIYSHRRAVCRGNISAFPQTDRDAGWGWGWPWEAADAGCVDYAQCRKQKEVASY